MKAVIAIDDSRTILKQLEVLCHQSIDNLKLFYKSTNPLEILEALPSIDDEVVIAFVDYNMAEMNGIDVAERLMNKIDARRIVLLTANVQKAVRDKAENLGIRFLEKPMTRDKLEHILSELIHEQNNQAN